MKSILVSFAILLSLSALPVTPEGICGAEITQETSVNEAIDIQKKCQVEKNLLLITRKADYDEFSLVHRQTAQSYQYTTSVIIFILVVTIVLFGLLFSWLEFRKGKNATTTLKFSSSGVEISSQIIGLIVLVISLGFAYIYIDKAYPISQIGNTQPSGVE